MGVGRGYLSMPSRTASVFIPDPFSTEPGACARSGDRAKCWADGTIEFLGRSTFKSKCAVTGSSSARSRRRSSQVPGVSEAVVIVREDTPGDKRLVAYCVCDKGRCDHRGVARVSRAADSKLHDSFFVRLPRCFPLSPNGKIDRKSLPAPDLSQSRRDSYVAPRDNVEIQLCEIWEKLLKVSPIGSMTTSLASEATRFWRCAWLLKCSSTSSARSRSPFFSKEAQSKNWQRCCASKSRRRNRLWLLFSRRASALRSSSCTSVATACNYLDLARYVGLDQPFALFRIRVCWAPCLISNRSNIWLSITSSAGRHRRQDLHGWWLVVW